MNVLYCKSRVDKQEILILGWVNLNYYNLKDNNYYALQCIFLNPFI